MDEAEVQDLKSETQTNTNNYQLTVGQSQGKQFNIGGNAGLNAHHSSMLEGSVWMQVTQVQ